MALSVLKNRVSHKQTKQKKQKDRAHIPSSFYGSPQQINGFPDLDGRRLEMHSLHEWPGTIFLFA
jgi:hypothetical protein